VSPVRRSVPAGTCSQRALRLARRRRLERPLPRGIAKFSKRIPLCVFGELGGVRVDDAANETNEEDAFAARDLDARVLHVTRVCKRAATTGMQSPSTGLELLLVLARHGPHLGRRHLVSARAGRETGRAHVRGLVVEARAAALEGRWLVQENVEREGRTIRVAFELRLLTCNQWQSVAVSGSQWQSVAISVQNTPPALAIRERSSPVCSPSMRHEYLTKKQSISSRCSGSTGGGR